MQLRTLEGLQETCRSMQVMGCESKCRGSALSPWEIDDDTDIGYFCNINTTSNQNSIGAEDYKLRSSFDKGIWNYEQEKSYWFETKDINKLDNSFPSETEKTENRNENQKTTGKDATVLKHKGKESAEKDLPPPAEELLLDNIEEKLGHMLEENPDIIKKNIKQFLENNRIIIKEIAIETGLTEESINVYIDGNYTFNEEQRRDFYRWYLLKILRPPNGSDEKSFTCYKCGKIFAYKSYLERHVKYVCPDNTGRTWKCSYCSKAFQYPCYLRRHIRSHTGESPYKCDKCDRAFVRSTDLQRHIRNHTGEKPYKCSECERAFARSTDLKRHMRTHTGEKPYKCWQCGKTFSQSGSLQTHLHTHNKDSGSVGRKHSKGSK
eukprot:gene10718-11866_t